MYISYTKVVKESNSTQGRDTGGGPPECPGRQRRGPPRGGRQRAKWATFRGPAQIRAPAPRN